eukprot:tig00000865_g5112.t1
MEESEAKRKENSHKWKIAIDGKYTSIVANVQCGLRTTSELLQRLKQRKKKEDIYGRSASEAWKEPVGTTEWGSLRQAWVAAFSVPTKIGQEALARGELLNELIKRTSALHSELSKFEERLHSEQAKLGKAVDAASDAMAAAALNSIRATAEAEAAGAAGRPVKTDSWLFECRYRTALSGLVAAQGKQKEALVAASQEAARLEQARVETSKKVLAEWLAGEKRALLEGLKAVDAALNLAALVSPEADAAKFSQRIVNNRPAEPPPDLTEGLIDVHASAMVEKHGVLKRQAAIIKIWKESYFVLTRNGFLHYFAGKEDGEPEESVPLHHASVLMSDASISEFSFELRAAEKGEGFFSRDRSWHLHLRAPSEEAMVEWVIALRKMIAGHGGEAPAPS